MNVIGANFMDYPGFKHTLGADKDPKIMEALLEEIPVGRLGATREAAHFAMALLDGYNMYTTGNFFPVASSSALSTLCTVGPSPSAHSVNGSIETADPATTVSQRPQLST